MSYRLEWAAKSDIDKSFFHLPRAIELARLRGKGPPIPQELVTDYIDALTNLGQIKLALKEQPCPRVHV